MQSVSGGALLREIRLFLTGQPGVGKSTIVRRLHEHLTAKGLRTGGMLSGEIREGGVRVGFEILDLQTGRKGTLAHVRQPSGPRIGKYTVNLEDLKSVGAGSILTAVSSCDAVFIDEVGPMELKSDEFKAAVVRALGSPKPLIGTIHRSASDPLVDQIKSEAHTTLVEVTYKNRDTLFAELEAQLQQVK
jgi:nucleoside-triphosphatase